MSTLVAKNCALLIAIFCALLISDYSYDIGSNEYVISENTCALENRLISITGISEETINGGLHEVRDKVELKGELIIKSEYIARIKLPQCTKYTIIPTNAGARITEMPLIDTSLSKYTDEADKNILVYPNPSRNIFKVQFKNDLGNQESSIKIVDFNGKVIFASKEVSLKQPFEIDLRHFEEGIYIGIIEVRGEKKSFKLSLKR